MDLVYMALIAVLLLAAIGLVELCGSLRRFEE
jgi:hypothetical protein